MVHKLIVIAQKVFRMPRTQMNKRTEELRKKMEDNNCTLSFEELIEMHMIAQRIYEETTPHE